LDKSSSDWKRMRFKQHKVWVAITPEGHLVEKSGKVLIKYQIDQEYEYWVHKSSIKPIDSDHSEVELSKETKPKQKPQKRTSDLSVHEFEEMEKSNSPHTVRIYTDGASSGNPGPSGIGVFMCFGDSEKEISKYIGEATNNIAEIEAIRTGLFVMKVTHLPVRIYTDSSYAIGVLTKGWRVKKNEDLIEETRALMSTFKDLKLVKVKGHTGITGKERANKLATNAVSKKNPIEKNIPKQ